MTEACLCCRLIGEPIDLGGHDEVVLVQAFDLFGLQAHGRMAPAEADIGMVAFRLGKLDRLMVTKRNASLKLRNLNLHSIRCASFCSCQPATWR